MQDTDVDTEKCLTGYHGTNSEFDSFDEAFFGSNSDRASNGFLGIWIAHHADLANRFGERIIRIDTNINEDSDACVNLAIEKLYNMHKESNRVECSRDFYIGIRNKFLSSGVKVLRIVEMSGESDMSIILDTDSIKNTYDISSTHSNFHL